MIRDRNIKWARQRMYIPVWQMQGYFLDATPAIAGIDTGAPLFGEVSSFGYNGLLIAAVNDSVSHMMEFPSCWDITKEIGLRIRWMVEGTVATTDAVVWTVVYDQADSGEACIDAGAALDTVITTQSPTATTTLFNYRSPRGIINANKFNTDALDGLLAFTIACSTLTGFSANEVVLLGMTFDYMPRLTVGEYNTTPEARQ